MEPLLLILLLFYSHFASALIINNGLILASSRNTATSSNASLHQAVDSTPLRRGFFGAPTCHSVTSPTMPSLNYHNCRRAYHESCFQFAIKTTRRHEWVWTERPGCAVAYHILDEQFHLDLITCLDRFVRLIDDCFVGQSRVNAGAFNVRKWPDAHQEGLPEESRDAMLVLAPERLT